MLFRSWVKEDLPVDTPDRIPYTVGHWKSGDTKAIAQCEGLFKNPSGQLKIVSMNIEALQRTKSPAEVFLTKFLKEHDCLLCIDESDTIKNPDAKRSETLMKLGLLAKYKRILTGTPLNNSPFDFYSQFTFLDKSIFGQSFFAYKHTYAEILQIGRAHV